MNSFISKLTLTSTLSLAMTAAAFAGCNGTPAGDGEGTGGAGMGGDSGTGGNGSGGGGQTEPGFAGEGLIFTIDAVNVSDTGVATVDFTITDDNEVRLDLEGKLTAGAVSPSFILSYLNETADDESAQYTAYTLRTKEAEEGYAVQSSTDTGGSYETLDLGQYRYTFGTKIDINSERAQLTHTLGVYATRSFLGERYVASALSSWVPDGSDVSTELDVVTDAACNDCHTRLEFHGGARRGVGMCNLCHTEENSINPESGNTIDFQVMIHKIHMGKDLPSVLAGENYYFVGYMGHVQDYSEVSYPWDMRDCSNCHDGSQGDRWASRPTEKPCSSCHDRTYFGEGDAPDGWTKHTAGPRDDSECGVCHGEDSLEPISKSHKTTLTDVDRPQVVAEILAVENSDPGQTPQMEFRVTVDGTAQDILASPMNRLRVKIWGQNTDPSLFISETIQQDGSVTAVECAQTPVAPCLEKKGDGFIFHFATALDAAAVGSYTAGMDGRIATDDGNVGLVTNPIMAFAVTGDLMPRREIVSLDNCNSCHGDLHIHGGSYKDPAYCLNCHNPGASSGGGALNPGESEVRNSINFKDLIHRVHAGAGYPAPLNDCSQCHIDGTQGVPLTSGLLPSIYVEANCAAGSPNCDTPTLTPVELQPESAACVTCHSSPSAVAHAETNTGSLGEACATCHGDGKDHGVNTVHAVAP